MVLSALCSGLEIAFVSSNRLVIELERKQGAFRARLLGGLMGRPNRVIGALLVGNNIALVIYGIVMARFLEPYLAAFWANEVFVLLTQTTLSTVIILIFSEFLPKAFFQLDPNGTLNLFAVPLVFLYVLLWIPMIVMTGLSQGLLRLFGIRTAPGQVAFGRIDLNEFLRELSQRGTDAQQLEPEVAYFRNTLELSNTKVRDVMVPRAEIVAEEVQEDIATLHRRFSETGLGKILIYKDSIDNIIGYVHAYDVFRRPRSIRHVLRPVNFIPGTMPADQVLQMFTKQRTHVAVVVDEFGGTAGLLTIEDVVESIVGEIEDEHDHGDEVEERLGPKEFLLSGRLEVARLAEVHGLSIPESGEYDTLAGYILHHTGGLPAPGEELVIGPYRITVVQVGHGRIDLVRLQVADAEAGLRVG